MLNRACFSLDHDHLSTFNNIWLSWILFCATNISRLRYSAYVTGLWKTAILRLFAYPLYPTYRRDPLLFMVRHQSLQYLYYEFHLSGGCRLESMWLFICCSPCQEWSTVVDQHSAVITTELNGFPFEHGFTESPLWNQFYAGISAINFSILR